MSKLPTVIFGLFEWHLEKERENIKRHGVDFYTATIAFLDSHWIVALDEKHSFSEERMFCIGKVNDRILTVRFTRRHERIRIFGAGYWRLGKKAYEEKNKR